MVTMTHNVFGAVLGMHRSGTSAVTRALNLLGAALPGEMMTNTHHNSSGHWEPLEVVAMHDRLLAGHGFVWDDPFIPQRICDASTAATRSASAEITAFVNQHVAPNPVALVKDPRICHTLPLWEAPLAQAGYSVAAIMMLRNPLEVAASLHARDQMPTQVGLQLWLRYTLAAEYHTRHLPRVQLRYDDLLNDWSAALAPVTSLLNLTLPETTSPLGQQLTAFLAKGERHHAIDDNALANHPDMIDHVAAVYALCHMDIADAAVQQQFDQIRQQLGQSDAAISPETAIYWDYRRRQHLREITQLKADIAWRASVMDAQTQELAWRKSVMQQHKLER
jgi:hypothetical protein